MSEKKVTFSTANIEHEMNPDSTESEDEEEAEKRQFNKFQLLGLVEGEDDDDNDETQQNNDGSHLSDETSSDTDGHNNDEKESAKTTTKAARDQSRSIVNNKRKPRKKRGKNKSSAKRTEVPMEDLDKQLELVALDIERSDDNSSKFASEMLKYKLLKVDMRNLVPEAELKRIFGKSVVKEDKSRRKTHPGSSHQRSRFVTSAYFETKPASPFTGPEMELDDTINNVRNGSMQQAGSAKSETTSTITSSNFTHPDRPIYFKFVHDKLYQEAQRMFLDAVHRGNTEYIIQNAQATPFHAESLVQLSHMIRVSEDYKTASEFIERALVVFEMGFHPRFNVTTATCRLSYKRPENRTFFITIFKHIICCHRRGLRRTPFEYSKLLLSLEPDNDPLMAVQLLDFFAIRCSEYDYLIDFYSQWESLRKLPNLTFSRALAKYFKSRCTKSSKAENDANLKLADDYLKQALLIFPNFIIPLLDACSGEPDSALKQCNYFDYSVYGTNYKLVPETVEVLVNLYVKRCYSLWKQKPVLTWLEKNVADMVAMFASGELTDKGEHIEHWSKFPKVVPKNLLRHIVLSDLDLTVPPSASMSAYIDIDPYPPTDSLVTYDASMRATNQSQSLRGGAASAASSLFEEVSSLFFRSILPSFSLNQSTETAPPTTSNEASARVHLRTTRLNDNRRIPNDGTAVLRISGADREIEHVLDREGAESVLHMIGEISELNGIQVEVVTGIAPDDQDQEATDEEPTNNGERRRRRNRGGQSDS